LIRRWIASRWAFRRFFRDRLNPDRPFSWLRIRDNPYFALLSGDGGCGLCHAEIVPANPVRAWTVLS